MVGERFDIGGAMRLASTYGGNTQTDRTRAGDTTFATSMIGVTSSTDATGTTDYILAPDGRVLGQTGPNGKTYYLLKDRLGSTTTVTNEAGTVVNRYWYDPYGNDEGGQAPDPDTDIPLVHWRYTGQWLDSDKVGSGNDKIGLRYYDPAQHRWTQTDPLERVTNPGQPAESQPYTYTGCNPTNHTDPTGAYSWDTFGDKAVAGVAGAAGAVIGGGIGLLAGPNGPAVGAYVGGTCLSGAVEEKLANPGATGGDVAAGCAGNVALGWLS